MKYSKLILLSSLLGLYIPTAVARDDNSNNATKSTGETTYPTSSAINSIPQPPKGMRWVLNEQYSDEFNGTELDTEKWFCLGLGTYWPGRPPGLFEPNNVSVEGGNLIIKGERMSKPYFIDRNNDGKPDKSGGRDFPSYFNISCGGVVSVEESATFGYYESKVKASNTALSTTFWLTHRSSGSTKVIPGVNQPTNMPAGSFSTELDICETLGSGVDDSKHWYNSFGKQMHANLHFRFIPEGERHFTDWGIPKSSKTTLSFPNNGYASEQYNTYGCWWKEGGSEIVFYLNNEDNVDVPLRSKAEDKPYRFSSPMGVNMVCETYDWVPFMDANGDNIYDTDSDGFPNELHPELFAALDDPDRNKSYYDWVRSYNLFPMSENVKMSQPTICFEDKVYLSSKPATVASSAKAVELEYQYSSNTEQMLIIYIYDQNGKICYKKSVAAYAGYANTSSTIKVKLSKGKSYYAVIYLYSDDAQMTNGDSFKFTAI